uniref:F-box family protein n=1 Tax=Solanum tuberosum TaxID=4113 RepID=M1BL28_SOLTU
MAKKSKKREDRLSDLPDSILIHILSMLCEDAEDSKKVVRTSLLSKRWQFLWKSVPVSLEIRFPDDCYSTTPAKWERDVLDYLNSTHRELHYWRSCHKIRKFSVVFNNRDPEKFVKDIDLWVYFASEVANVEHFKLISEDGAMEKILSGCPNLECLKLDHFWGFHRLEISNVKSRKLIMDNLETDECDVWLEIIAPYIQNLEIQGTCRGIYLRNVASLVTAVLNFDFDFEFEEQDPLQRTESTCVNELFHSVAHVEKLELGHWCIKSSSDLETLVIDGYNFQSRYLSILELEGWQPPPSSWKFLQLSTTLRQLDFPGICSFLQSSSDLETLVVDGYGESRALLLRYTNTDKQIRRFETHDLNCSFLHLKTIKILEFSVSVMPLVKYLLKHAVVLEKFIIAAKYKKSDLYYVKRAQELLSIPRSSPQASVIFSYR